MREETYDISGMHCAACSASVERVTRKLPGVERSDVNLTTEKMTIRYDETKVTPEDVYKRQLQDGKVHRMGVHGEEIRQRQRRQSEGKHLSHGHI